MRSLLPPERQVATLLTMITVDPDDPGSPWIADGNTSTTPGPGMCSLHTGPPA